MERLGGPLSVCRLITRPILIAASPSRREVVYGSAEAFVEVHQRCIAQDPLGLGYVGERVGHVARAGGDVVAAESTAEHLFQSHDDLEEAHALTTAHVEGLAADAGGAGRE